MLRVNLKRPEEKHACFLLPASAKTLYQFYQAESKQMIVILFLNGYYHKIPLAHLFWQYVP